MVAVSRELPASGYALEVDGRLKAEFATRDGAKTGAEELKKRLPMLQIRIYDAQTKTREDVELSFSRAEGRLPSGPGCRLPLKARLALGFHPSGFHP